MNYCYKVNVALTTQSKVLNKKNQAILWLVLSDVIFLTKKELKDLFKKIEINLGIKLYKCSSIYASINNDRFELSVLKDRFDNEDIFIKNGLLEDHYKEESLDEVVMFQFLIERKNNEFNFKYKNRTLLKKSNFFRELARKNLGKLYESLLEDGEIKKKWIIDIANILFSYKRSISHPKIINTQTAYSLLDVIDNKTQTKKYKKYNYVYFLKNESGCFLLYNNQYKCICCVLPPSIYNTNKKIKIDIVNDNISILLNKKKISLNTIYNAGNQTVSDLKLTTEKIKKIKI
ncbi:hypothetical protein ACVA6E_12790 [Photobacterium damselae]